MDHSGNSPKNSDVVECVKARLLEEGREARNLIAYSLPMENLKSPRLSGANRQKECLNKPNKEVKKVAIGFNTTQQPNTSLHDKQRKRPRSASAGRDPQSNLRARHWGFLFRNLEQAVGELYQTCEDDESISECKEAILMLERYTSDFYNLIEWFNLKLEYESTPPLERPTSVSWKIRTSSPWKTFFREKKVPSGSSAKVFLQFDKPPSTCTEDEVEKTPFEACSLTNTANTNSLSNNLELEATSFNENISHQSEIDKNKSLIKDINVPDSENNMQIQLSIPKQIVHPCDLDVPADPKEIKYEVVTEYKLQGNTNESLSSSPQEILSTIPEVGKEPITSETDSEKSIDVASKQLHKKCHSDHLKKASFNKHQTKSLNEKSLMHSERLTQKEMIWQHLDGNGCSSCNLMEENEKIVFMDKQKFDHLTPCAEVLKKKMDSPDHTLPLKHEAIKETQPVLHSMDEGTKAELKNGSSPKQTEQKTNESKNEDHSAAEKSPSVSPIKSSQTTQPITNDSSNIEKRSEKQPEVASDKTKNVTKIQPSKGGGDAESRKNCEGQQIKAVYTRPVPQVNMNKASQVRQAYNQSRTPQKAPCSNNWKASETKGTVAPKQQLSSSRSFRRFCDGRAPSSPPQRRRMPANTFRSSNHRTALERSNSSTTFSMPKNLVRFHSTLGDSPFSKNYSFHRKNSSTSQSGDKSSSISSLTSSCTTSSGQSWADKVRGGNSASSDQPSESYISLQDDDEGWEVVRRGRRSHCSSSTSINSTQAGSLKFSSQFNNMKGPRKFDAKTRFHQPTSAVSMPSLADKLPVQETKVISTEPSTPRQSSFDDASITISQNASPSEPLKWNALTARKRSKSDNLKEPKSRKGNERRRSHPKKQDSSSSDKEFKTWLNDVKSVPMEKHKKNITNSSKKNEMRKGLLLASSGKESSHQLEEDPIPNNDANAENLATADTSSSEAKNEHDFQNKSDLPTTNIDVASLCNVLEQEDRTKEPSCASSSTHSDDGESDAEEEKIRSNAAALESATKEEIRLKQQIKETQSRAFEVSEEVEGDYEEEGRAGESDDGRKKPDCNTEDKRERDEEVMSPPLDQFYDYIPKFKKLSSLSWAEEVDAFENMDPFRSPGRVLHIHEKLSSPSRKLPISEKYRRHKEKLAKAEKLRGKMIQDKKEKLKDLTKRIDEVNKDKERLLAEKRKLFERKMERAEEKRRRHLQEIINKAHDEENKAKEIAFINGLEAENKRHDIMQQHQSHDARLADMAEERSRKQEEKAAKEAAAQERRKALEVERQARMVELCEKRRKRCERIDRQQAERREELLEQAREKARDREERLCALQQAQQAKESELVKKIQQKQEETARRHEENIEQIRQRALESSIMRYSRDCDDAPKLLRYETKKLCTLCSSLIASDVYLLSHLRGKQHQEALKELYKDEATNEETATFNLKHIIDAPASIDDPQVTRDKERQKALKKRYRKIRTRMISRGKEYLVNYQPPTKDASNKTKLSKSLQQISKLLSNQGTGPWPAADTNLLDRHLLELLRIIEKKNPSDQMTFAALDGFSKLNSILGLITETKEFDSCVIPARSLGYCAKVVLSACRSSVNNCKFLLFSNFAGNYIEQLLRRLVDLSAELVRIGSSSSLNNLPALPSDPAAVGLIEVLSEMLNVLKDKSSTNADMSIEEKEEAEGIWQRLQDIISFCVSIGIVDKTTWYFNHIQYPVDNDASSADFITAAMMILTSLSNALINRNLTGDPTQLVGTIHVTEACGVLSLLYGLLLHQGGRSSSPPNLLSPSTMSITAAATKLLHSLAELDLTMFQSILGSEGISLEFRHISSFLLWYCSHSPCEEVLHNILSLVGFFAVGNKENQMVIQSGETPSVLQQLCSLPWQYFSEPRLTSVLFPTLLSCCWQNPVNMNILLQEMSFQVLEDFLKTDEAARIPLVKIFQKSILTQESKS